MSMNCDQCLHKCGAECCSNVPMTKEFMATHTPVRPITGIVEFGDNMVVPETASGRCPFLSEDFKCTVYKDRPKVCQVFGDESTIFATCSWQDKNGRMRSRQEKRYLDRTTAKRQNYLIKSMQEGRPQALSVQELQRQKLSFDDFNTTTPPGVVG